jgi:hypothetical protein
MGKSFKKNPVKKIHGRSKEDYWSKVRSRTKTILNSTPVEELDEKIPDPKELINDYSYIDWVGRDETDDKYYRK